MRISLDPKSAIPLYQQIETHIRQGILSGQLPADLRLPATRRLAADLGVSRNTVETAYAELESAGLVYSRMGSGTYVQILAPLPSLPQCDPDEPWPLWQREFRLGAGRTDRIPPEETPDFNYHSDPVHFSHSVGDCQYFPVEDFRKTLQNCLRRDGISALEYGEKNGYEPLRNTISHVLASQGLQVSPERVLVTSGSQQALALTAKLLLKFDDVVLVEDPTYGGALKLFRSLGLKTVGIPVDQDGMQVEELEAVLQQYHPKLIYTIPNFQNPTGSCMSLHRRRQLLALADRYNVPILEDDYVGDLRYDGVALPALKALDPGGRVIYASTFSKMLMPGLRVGFLVADGPVYDHLVQFKYVNDLATSGLIQRAVESYVTVGRYQAHLRRSCRLYRKRRDALLAAIKRYLTGVQVIPPHGGLFAWLKLPDGISSERLLPLACKNGVSFYPGGHFFQNYSDGDAYIRLNFAAQPLETIDAGIRRLAKAVGVARSATFAEQTQELHR